jgi:hypothetical protein
MWTSFFSRRGDEFGVDMAVRAVRTITPDFVYVGLLEDFASAT